MWLAITFVVALCRMLYAEKITILGFAAFLAVQCSRHRHRHVKNARDSCLLQHIYSLFWKSRCLTVRA